MQKIIDDNGIENMSVTSECRWEIVGRAMTEIKRKANRVN